jgi:glycosyltransferase involved in cell wall biosynthesis
MTVLFFLRNFLPFTSGNGASVMTWAFAHQLIRDGHKVVICRFESSDNGGWQWLADAEALMASYGILVRKVSAPDFRRGNRLVRGLKRIVTTLRRPIHPKLEDFYPSKVSLEELQRLIQEERPDVLYAYDMSAIALLTRLPARPPIIASIVDLPAEWLRHRRKYKPQRSNLGWAQRVLDLLAERKVEEHSLDCLRRCDSVIEHAAHHARWLQDHGIRCVYLPNPVQDPVERGVQLCETKPPAVGRIKVGMMGSNRGLATIAGLKFFVDRLLPALTTADRAMFEFHIFGGGDPPKPILKRLREDHNVRIRGHVTDIDSEFLSSRFLLVPTPIDLGFRTRIAESFGYGTVVVAHTANAEGMPELKHLQNCLLCSQPDQFLTAFRQLASDDELLARLSRNARSSFEQHYASRVVSRKMIEAALQVTGNLA